MISALASEALRRQSGGNGVGRSRQHGRMPRTSGVTTARGETGARLGNIDRGRLASKGHSNAGGGIHESHGDDRDQQEDLDTFFYLGGPEGG